MKSRQKDVELGVRDRVNLVAHGTESVPGAGLPAVLSRAFESW